MNRFMAHISRQQRLTPVQPLPERIEDFGLWTIADDLETADTRDYGEAAAVWLLIAGDDIHGDLRWGNAMATRHLEFRSAKGICGK